MDWTNFGKFLNKNRGVLGNLGTGLASGWGTQGQRQGDYIPMSSWAGNGLARTRLQYIPNYNYVNPYDALNAGFAQGRNRRLDGFNFDKANNKTQYALQNIYGKLAGLGGNIGQFARNKWWNIINRRFGNKGDVNVPLYDYNAYGETIA